MGCWIKGPNRYSWPAITKPQPNTPHEAAIANREEQVAPKRTRRTTKKAND